MARERLAAAEREGLAIVVSDIPLLFEVGLAGRFDRIVLVDAPESTRLDRLVRQRVLPEDEARQMVAAQMPSAEKRPLAHYVIDNEGTLTELETRADEVWDALVREASAGAGDARRGASRSPSRHP